MTFLKSDSRRYSWRANPRYEQTRVWGESGVGMMWTNYMVLLGVPNYFVDGDAQQLPYFWAGVTPPNSSIPYTLTEGFGWNCNFASVWKTFMKNLVALKGFLWPIPLTTRMLSSARDPHGPRLDQSAMVGMTGKSLVHPNRQKGSVCASSSCDVAPGVLNPVCVVAMCCFFP